jgi:hypothetical protein
MNIIKIGIIIYANIPIIINPTYNINSSHE